MINVIIKATKKHVICQHAPNIDIEFHTWSKLIYCFLSLNQLTSSSKYLLNLDNEKVTYLDMRSNLLPNFTLYCEINGYLFLSLRSCVCPLTPGQLDNEGDEGKVMSQVVVAEDDCCDNKPHPDPHTAQPQNLNEINPATRIEQTSALQNDFGAGLPVKASLNNNGENKEELERHKSASNEEEQDTDELMKDEEEESEASSCQLHCQFPDTPMSDSSYSETGTESR